MTTTLVNDQTSESHSVDEKGIQAMAAKTLTKHEWKLDVVLPERLILGQDWPMKVILTNESGEAVNLAVMVDYHDIYLEIVDGAGNIVPRTEYGKRVLQGPAGVFGSAITQSIQSGKSYTWEIEFGKCFDLKPGKYRGVAEWERLTRHLVSDEFKFEVLSLQ